MAVLKVFVSGKDVDWGQSQSVLPTDYGIITDMKEAISADREEIPDGNGEAAGLVFYNGKRTFDCTVIAKPAASLPAIVPLMPSRASSSVPFTPSAAHRSISGWRSAAGSSNDAKR